METTPSTETPDMLDEVLDLFRSMEELPQPDEVLPLDAPGDSPARAFKLPEPPPVWLTDFDAVLRQVVFSELALPVPTKEEAESLLNELLREQAAEATSPPSVKVECQTPQTDVPDQSSFLATQENNALGLPPRAMLWADQCRPFGAEEKSPGLFVFRPEGAALASPGHRPGNEPPQPQPASPLLREPLPPLDDLPCSHAEALRQACLKGLNLSEAARAEAERGQPYLLIGLGEAEYAVALGAVLEICRPPFVTPLPHVPHWIRGVSNLRGDILSVVDLGSFLGLAPRPKDGDPSGSASPARRRPRLLVVHDNRDDVTLGLLVDGAGEICRVPEQRMTPLTVPVETALQPYLLGQLEAGSRLLGVLDLERLLVRMNEVSIP